MNTFFIVISTWYVLPALFTISGISWALWREDPIDILRRLLIVLPASNAAWIVAGFLK